MAQWSSLHAEPLNINPEITLRPPPFDLPSTRSVFPFDNNRPRLRLAILPRLPNLTQSDPFTFYRLLQPLQPTCHQHHHRQHLIERGLLVRLLSVLTLPVPKVPPTSFRESTCTLQYRLSSRPLRLSCRVPSAFPAPAV